MVLCDYMQQVAEIVVCVVADEENAGTNEQRPANLIKEFAPEDKRTYSPLRVELVRSITHADDSRLARRTGAAVRRTVSIDEHHICTRAAQVVGDPRAERACADDREIIGLRHELSRKPNWR